MKYIKIITALFFVVIVSFIVGVNLLNDNQPSHGVGLTVAAEKDLEALEKKSDLIVNAQVDENYDTRKRLEDEEHDVYQINRVYTATVKNSFKDSIGKKYKKGYKIEFIYPIGFKQMKNGELRDELLPLGDKIIPIESGEYMLFLTEIDGQYMFSNVNHVYKKGGNDHYKNISTDSIPTITEENILND